MDSVYCAAVNNEARSQSLCDRGESEELSVFCWNWPSFAAEGAVRCASAPLERGGKYNRIGALCLINVADRYSG